MKRVLAVGLMAGLVVLAAGAAIAQEVEAAPAGKMQDVESTAIKAVGYDEATEALTVEFVSGVIYEYAGVPKAVYEAFMAAESKGEFFQESIKGKYEFSKK